MASKTISFRIFRNDQLVETRSFDQDVIKVGRLASSHLRLDDASLARMHAVIEVGFDGNVRIVDLGSSSGTRVNGQLIDRNRAMNDGDVIEVGCYRLEAAIADARTISERAVEVRPVEVRPMAIAPSVTPAAAPTARVDLSTVEDASAQVVEVVASYARSVLDVAHVGQSRSRRSSSLPLMAFGGALMLGGIGLFGYEVAQPWDEYSSAVAEAQKLRREAPPAPGLGTGSLGMLLALLGLVPFVAGGMRRREMGLDAYLIGEGDEANFKVRGGDLPNPAASALVSRHAEGYALAFTPSMQGSVDFGSGSISLADLVASGRAHAVDGTYQYVLPNGAKAKVMHGDVRFDVSVVNRGSIVAGRGEIDWPFWSYFGGTATIGTAFYLLMRAMPDDALAMQLADNEASVRFASYFHQADEQVQDMAEPVEVDQPVNEEKAQSGETGKRASGPEGRLGDPSKRSTNGAYAVKGPRDAVPQIGRTFDPTASAREAGILGILAQQDSHFIAAVDGGPFTIGRDDEDVWGNIVGVEHAASYGNAGLGLVGSGRGGGGAAGGLIGMGNHGLLGHGNGNGGLYYGNEDGKGKTTQFGPRKEKIPNPRVGKGEVNGDIDKDLIRRIVRAHLNEVRSCYNSGLTRNPNLEGRVTVQFSIIGTGKVASSVVQENTTKDSAVADCIAKAVKRWTFPRVGKGGTALVTYPFLLTAH